MISDQSLLLSTNVLNDNRLKFNDQNNYYSVYVYINSIIHMYVIQA